MIDLVTEVNTLRDKLVECLELINQIDARMDAERTSAASDNTSPSASPPVCDSEDALRDATEVEKIARKLPKWGRNPKQYNTRILNAYLTLRRKSHVPIEQQDIAVALGNPNWFRRNFNQMVNFGTQNHGKIFQRADDFVEVWEPVQSLVEEYEADFSYLLRS